MQHPIIKFSQARFSDWRPTNSYNSKCTEGNSSNWY